MNLTTFRIWCYVCEREVFLEQRPALVPVSAGPHHCKTTDRSHRRTNVCLVYNNIDKICVKYSAEYRAWGLMIAAAHVFVFGESSTESLTIFNEAHSCLWLILCTLAFAWNKGWSGLVMERISSVWINCASKSDACLVCGVFLLSFAPQHS